MGGSSLAPITCVNTREEKYFPRNLSRSMCIDRWNGLGINFMSRIAQSCEVMKDIHPHEHPWNEGALMH
jgi:hypothetical protein